MKIVNKSYRYRFYPTQSQKTQLSHAFGCSRFVYNHFLKERTDAYFDRKEKLNYHKTSQLLTALKNNENNCWLKDVSSVTLQQSLRDLDKAFTNFFQVELDTPSLKKRTQSNRFDMLSLHLVFLMGF
jgi:putative transposase